MSFRCPTFTSLSCLTTVLIITPLGIGTAMAQEPAETVTSDTGVTTTDAGNRVIYSPEYFARYNVVTARDQLDRIPGLQDIFNQNNGGNQRGFGNSGDQVLINGKRLSGKSNNIGSAMDRIQARQVVRIEVIRGTVAGLDVRSEGRIVNVVLDGTLVAGIGSWQANVEDYSDGTYGGGGELSYSGDFGALNYLVSAESNSRKNITDRTDRFYTPDFQLFERQLEAERERTREHTFTTNTSYTFANNDILNLNGRYQYSDETGNESSDRFAGTGALAFTNNLLIASTDLSKEWELGGDFEHTFDNGNVLNALFVVTEDTGDEADSFAVTPAGEPRFIRQIQAENQTASEKIVRSTYQWGTTETRTIQSGAEFALNTVEQRVQLLENNDGVLEEVELFNQDSTVEETRFEAFTTYSWQLQPSLLVEGSLDLEFSELTQEGRDINRSREFFFARPRLVVRYDLSPLTQLRARIERRVDQLDFGDFVASFSNDDNRVDVISAGNPELVPEQAWEYELTYEHRLADDVGIFSVTATYSDIRDRISSVPLLVVDENGVEQIRTATGNIDSGRRYQLSFDGSVRLAWLGLRSVLIEGSVELQDTTLRDPFTGNERDFNFASPYEWSLGFRHDTNWHNLSYGVTASQNGPWENYDLDYSQEEEQEPELELFMEVQPIENFTVELEVEQTLRSETTRERLQFDDNRIDGVLDRRELRTGRSGREITLTFRGVF